MECHINFQWRKQYIQDFKILEYNKDQLTTMRNIRHLNDIILLQRLRTFYEIYNIRSKVIMKNKVMQQCLIQLRQIEVLILFKDILSYLIIDIGALQCPVNQPQFYQNQHLWMYTHIVVQVVLKEDVIFLVPVIDTQIPTGKIFYIACL
ncbi:unnamed protein product [Paramecium sonneborni]|uniref:Uncharacterized protein n=1 Tax=Paramecium sonneborni TaxID=65129 RepID=A0A8S1R869_9CILI|nr:unnamed protein product [Paramecium sonneborni]